MSERILVIEDEESLRRNLETYLGNLGHSVRSAACGQDAVGLLYHEQFDIVITDIQLGDMDGLDLVRWITSWSSQTGVLVMTAYGSQDAAIQVFRMGAHDYLQKPFSLEALGQKVEIAAKQRQTVQQNLALRRKTQEHHDS